MSLAPLFRPYLKNNNKNDICSLRTPMWVVWIIFCVSMPFCVPCWPVVGSSWPKFYTAILRTGVHNITQGSDTGLARLENNVKWFWNISNFWKVGIAPQKKYGGKKLLFSPDKRKTVKNYIWKVWHFHSLRRMFATIFSSFVIWFPYFIWIWIPNILCP